MTNCPGFSRTSPDLALKIPHHGKTHSGFKKALSSAVGVEVWGKRTKPTQWPPKYELKAELFPMIDDPASIVAVTIFHNLHFTGMSTGKGNREVKISYCYMAQKEICHCWGF